MQDTHNRILKKVNTRIENMPSFVEDFISYRIDASPHTLDNYTRDYEGFFTWLVANNYYNGKLIEMPIYILEQLRTTDINKYERHCLIELENKVDTVARKMASLKSLFHYLSQIAEDEELMPYLQRNVMAKVDIRKEKISERRRAEIMSRKILIDDEFNFFREFVGSEYEKTINNQKRLHNAYLKNRERDLALISLILGSGLRISEALSVNVSDIDWDKNIMLITRKGDSRDVASFSERAKEDMLSYKMIRNTRYGVTPSLDAFFVSGKTNNGKSQRLTVRAAQKMFEKYTKAYGKTLSLHKLRHSFATKHYKENKDLATLMRILGHRKPETTMIYTQISDLQIQKSIDKADS